MNRSTDPRGAAVAALASLLFLPVSPPVFAETPAKSDAVVKPLLTQDLADIPGKEAVMLTVEYPPGGASVAHRHDAEVFVYVLEGSIVMQVDGKEPVTLQAGQTFHENPKDIHRQSANASKTQPARFVVFIVKDKGKPISRPLTGN
jgi:quercetin dioxygenase-like cupin family protein